MRVAYSPCPNDTFMFNAIANGILAIPGYNTEIHLHDVETLNKRAASCEYDITKLSIHACLKVREHYSVLNSGAALGFGCGPIVVCRDNREINDLRNCSVAVPGELTTAHLLFRLRFPECSERVFMPFDKIMKSVESGSSDIGIVIHEGRFTYKSHGLRRIIDLGEWWQDETGLPLPLGCIAARKAIGKEMIRSFDILLRESIEKAMAEPELTLDYVTAHAQEMERSVLRKHIKTFVNSYSIDMGDIGREAVSIMKQMAAKAGIL